MGDQEREYRGAQREVDQVSCQAVGHLLNGRSGMLCFLDGFNYLAEYGFLAKAVSTSFAERHNWTMRTNMRRYTRLSNGFSRKVQNHEAAVALNYFAYNFIKIHRTLRVTPAMAAGVTNRLWEVVDLVALWESYERDDERAA